MKTRASAAAIASIVVLASAGNARAAAVVALGSNDPPSIQEDWIFLVHDEAQKREHLIFAARVSPGSAKLSIGIPTPKEPSIEPLPSFDPGRVLFSLLAPHEERTRKRPPAEPAAWVTRGATVSGDVSLLRASEVLFDASWRNGYADRGLSHIAMLGVTAPADGRVEVTTPAARISFEAERLILPRREPRIERKEAKEAADEPREGGPALPLEVKGIKAEPKDASPSAEAIARILRGESGPLLGCYETFLERRPAEAATITVEVVVRPKGEIASLKSVGGVTGEHAKEFVGCVVAELRKKRLPRMDEGWRFTADLAFTPPRLPTRRTHVVLVSTSREVWRSPPRAARLVADFEARPEDVDRAFGAEYRRVLGLPAGQRIWVTYWLDRDERRALAEDALFDNEAIPPDGSPGTLSFRQAEEPPAANSVKPQEQTHRKPARRGRRGAAFGLLFASVLVTALALWLSRDERPTR